MTNTLFSFYNGGLKWDELVCFFDGFLRGNLKIVWVHYFECSTLHSPIKFKYITTLILIALENDNIDCDLFVNIIN